MYDYFFNYEAENLTKGHAFVIILQLNLEHGLRT